MKRMLYSRKLWYTILILVGAIWLNAVGVPADILGIWFMAIGVPLLGAQGTSDAIERVKVLSSSIAKRTLTSQNVERFVSSSIAKWKGSQDGKQE